MISVAGADFSATINGEDIPLCQPVIVSKNSILQFQRWKQGARCYLAIKENLNIQKWLNSYSTNIKAACGGFNGRPLQKDDVISFKEKNQYKNFLGDEDFSLLPWKADIVWNETPIDRIALFPGNEWEWLTENSKKEFLNESFTIGSLADRMGYRLQTTLQAKENNELVSAAVSFGTIQLLPNGELIILMADHQTTGGYPRVGHVISAHLPLLAQKQPGDKIYFRLTDQQHAEDLFLKQQQHLLQLQNACKFKLEEFLNAGN
jgi:antagonist of KipI